MNTNLDNKEYSKEFYNEDENSYQEHHQQKSQEIYETMRDDIERLSKSYESQCEIHPGFSRF